MPSPPVNTGKVAGRRPLRFASIPDMLADAERLAAADRAGRLITRGNWTLGQALGHLASWMSYPFDGYPAELARPPWIIKFLLRLKKNTYFNKALPSGVKIPGVKGGTTGTELLSTEDGLARLRAAAHRMHNTAPAIPNPIFGPLSHETWRMINCRHAELHLSFFDIAPSAL